MAPAKSADISQAVLENGLDSLSHAVEEMAKRPANGKHAAIHLFGAIEVLIKARLIREHWTLACAKVDGATLAGFKNGDLPTVDGMQGLKRLENAAGLSISNQQTQNVDAVRRLRNRVAHFAVVGINPAAINVELARGLDFIVWFLEKHILPGAPQHEVDLVEASLAAVSTVLSEIKEFVAARLATLRSQLDAAEILLQCPQCAQPTLTVENAPRCLFCWWASSDAEDGAEEYVTAVLGLSSYRVVSQGGDWPVAECPECYVNSLVEGAQVVAGSAAKIGARDSVSDMDLVCFNCGLHCSHSLLDRCSQCGAWTSTAGGICPDCISALISRD